MIDKRIIMPKLPSLYLLLILVTTAFGHSIDDVLDAVKDNKLEDLKKIISESKDTIGTFINKKHAQDGQTPLMKAVLFGRTEMVEELLKLDEVDVTIGEKDGYTPMHGAGFQGRAEIMKMLLADRRGMDPNHYHRDGYTPLHRACWGMEQRHIDTIRVLVDSGRVNHRIKAKNGKTCKQIAGHPGIQELYDELDQEARTEL